MREERGRDYNAAIGALTSREERKDVPSLREGENRGSVHDSDTMSCKIRIIETLMISELICI